MKIKEILKDCTINPPHVVISLLFNKEWNDIELWGDGDYADFIEEYGNSDVYNWTIENIDTDTYVLFSIKKLVTKE